MNHKRKDFQNNTSDIVIANPNSLGFWQIYFTHARSSATNRFPKPFCFELYQWAACAISCLANGKRIGLYITDFFQYHLMHHQNLLLLQDLIDTLDCVHELYLPASQVCLVLLDQCLWTWLLIHSILQLEYTPVVFPWLSEMYCSFMSNKFKHWQIRRVLNLYLNKDTPTRVHLKIRSRANAK